MGGTGSPEGCTSVWAGTTSVPPPGSMLCPFIEPSTVGSEQPDRQNLEEELLYHKLGDVVLIGEAD